MTTMTTFTPSTSTQSVSLSIKPSSTVVINFYSTTSQLYLSLSNSGVDNAYQRYTLPQTMTSPIYLRGLDSSALFFKLSSPDPTAFVSFLVVG